MLYDPGDVLYNPNTLRSDNQQVLGDVIVQAPKAGAIGAVLTTVRVSGAGATGVYNRLHKRMHTDFFYVSVVAS
jgi:hypothetical protein